MNCTLCGTPTEKPRYGVRFDDGQWIERFDSLSLAGDPKAVKERVKAWEKNPGQPLTDHLRMHRGPKPTVWRGGTDSAAYIAKLSGDGATVLPICEGCVP